MSKSDIIIKQISAQETIPVRHPELRKGKPIEDCIFDGDNLSTTFHLGLFLNTHLVGVATFLENNNTLFQSGQLQLRGMAVLAKHQGKKLGDLLLNKAEELAIAKNKSIIWCNARLIAVNFYKRAGYQTIGNSFEIKNVGTHFVMFKEIK